MEPCLLSKLPNVTPSHVSTYIIVCVCYKLIIVSRTQRKSKIQRWLGSMVGCSCVNYNASFQIPRFNKVPFTSTFFKLTRLLDILHNEYVRHIPDVKNSATSPLLDSQARDLESTLNKLYLICKLHKM